MFNGERISELLDNRMIHKIKLYSYLGVTANGLDKMIKNQSNPRADNIEKLADFFNVSIDFFFDREFQTKVTSDNLTEYLQQQLNKAREEVGSLKAENKRLNDELNNKKTSGGTTSIAAEDKLNYAKLDHE